MAWPRREGGGNTRSGVADALHRPAGCLWQAVSLRSAVPPEQRRPSLKDTQPYGREQERPSGRVARSVTARCGDAPSRAPCHRAFLALARRFLIFSQVLRARHRRVDLVCWPAKGSSALSRPLIRQPVPNPPSRLCLLNQAAGAAAIHRAISPMIRISRTAIGTLGHVVLPRNAS